MDSTIGGYKGTARTVTGNSGGIPSAVERALREMHAQTAEAALAFESRWTWLALRRVDADVAERLHDQRHRYTHACITGGPAEIRSEGDALCRGYRVAAQVLQDAHAVDDAYMVGRCPNTGLTIALSESAAAAARVHELYGEDVVWFTPDEIATLMASPTTLLQTTLAVKKKFPGAQVVMNETKIT